MSNQSETLIDPPDFGHGLSNPSFDHTYLSQQPIDDFSFDPSFSIDDFLDLDQLLNSDSDPLFDSDHFGLNDALDCQNPVSPESNGSNGVEKSDSSGNCVSNVSGESKNEGPVSYSPVSNTSEVKVGNFHNNDASNGFGKCDSSGNCVSNVSGESKNGDPVSYSPVSNTSEVKVGNFDSNDGLNGSVKRDKIRKRKTIDEIEIKDCSFDNCGMSEEEKRKARLVRNRESAHLSRQRKKHYVEELEDKVKNMHAMIQDLNMKVSYFMAENVTLRQQTGGVVVPPVPMMYPPPPPGVMYPWMGYPPPPPYMMKNGSQVLPIPRMKPQPTVSKKGESKKVESKKSESKRTKKVASVSFLGLLFFIMLFGGLVPIMNVKYGGIKESFVGRESYVGGGTYENRNGRVLMVNGTVGGDRGQCVGEGKEFRGCNGSEPLTASLYVPRNDKLVKIDGNLIIHSVLASEKSMSTSGKEDGESGLAVREDLSPAIPVAGVTRAGAKHLPARAADGKIQEWFREGLAGPMLSGMCTEVFQFDVSSAIVPASSPTNISKDQNITELGQQRNRRILYDHPIPLSKSSLNISEREKLKGNNNASSSVVVSVLVDPREASDIDGVLGTKSISRIFVVVLIDSVKYVTYSCMLPFKGSTAPHLVTT